MQAPTPNGRATVVGSGGFIGRSLAEALESTGAEVVRVTRSTPLSPGSEIWDAVVASKTIFWAASSINPQIAAEHPERAELDRRSMRDFLAGLSDSGSSSRVVLLSSGGTVYGDSMPPPHSEEAPTRPTSAYGAAKLALEDDLLRWEGTGTVARISNAYGPGQRIAPGQGVIGHWLRALRDRAEITVIGSPESARDYVYIADLVECFVMLHQHVGKVPTILNVGSGRPTPLSEVLASVENVSDQHDPVVVFRPARNFDLRDSWLDTRLATSALGWTAKTPLDDGIAAMWAWVVREGATAR